MDNLNGFIKIHRKLLMWEWYTDINVRVLFFHCLLRANHKPEKWHGIELEAGQFITSYEHLAKECGLTTQQTRTAIFKLKSTGEITNKTTSRYSIITVNNWKSYQANNKQNNKQITNNQQTNNNRQEIKKERDINISLSKKERELLKTYCKRKRIENVNAYIRKVIDNGDWALLVEEEQKRQLKKQKLEQIKTPEITEDIPADKVHELFSKVRNNLRRAK